MNKSVLLVLASVAVWVGVSCGANAPADQGSAAKKVQAVAKVEPTKGNQAKGTVTFTQDGDKVLMVADISGLKPNALHGFHIHDGAECGDDGMLAGGHWNPDNNPHAGPKDAKRHAGDLGNIKADEKGNAHLEMTLEGVSVSGPKNAVIGHSVMVHGGEDDLKSQPAGNAGARIACGPIKLVEQK